MKVYKKLFIFTMIFIVFIIFSSASVFAYDEFELNDYEKIKYETVCLTTQSYNEESQSENEYYIYIGYNSVVQYTSYAININDTINTRRTDLNGLKNQLELAYDQFFQYIRPGLIESFTENVVNQMYFSEYSPYIALDLYSIINYVEEENFFNSLREYSELDIVTQIYVVEFIYINETEVSDTTNVEEYPFQTALSDVGVNNSQFDGTGINVGIWEVDSPGFNFYNSLFENRNVEFFETPFTYYNQHADIVTQISTGKIATDSNIFYAEFKGNLIDKLDWFVENNVDVINMSLGISIIDESGNDRVINDYTFMDSIIDYYSKYTRTTFVISAGNNGNDSNNQYLISTPANSLNAITVGASDSDGEIATFSSHVSFSNVKPNIVAPGAYLTNISEDYVTQRSGTSYSAPIVTGIIALLMEEYPYLVGNPESVLAVLQSSATQLPSQIEDFDDISGTGIINYSRARECAENVSSFFISGEKNEGTVVFEKIISLGGMQSIESSLFLTNDTNFSSLTQFNELDICSYYYEKLKIELYDNTTGKLLKTVTLAENTDKISYYNTTNYDLNLKIKVILTEYKDSESANSIGVISHLVRDILPTETLTINGTLEQLTRVNYLSSNNELLYRINANEFSYYVFEASSEKPIYIYLYDSEFNLLNASPCITVNGSLYFSEHLSNDVVYVKIKFESIRDTGNVNILIRQETYKQVWFNSESDLLPYLHEHLNDLMAHGYYINYQNAGFYEVELYAENSDGQIYDLPYGTITIKDNNDEYIINKYEFDEFSTVAKNSDGNNSIIVYLPRSGYFYFHISLPLDNYTNLKIRIKPIENESINLFELPENTNDELDLITSSQNSDYIKRINLNQTGKFTIKFENSVEPNDDLLFVIAKLNYNSVTQRYSLETILAELTDNLSSQYDLKLEEGIYYIGYFNNDINNIINVKLERIITQSGSAPLITDPDHITDCGSQVNIYEKALLPSDRSYRGTNIVIGFTRVIYIDYHYVNQYSREDYYWYSSNDSIATVSQHGTVFGKSVGTVKIMAVNKDDPSIVFVKQFTVIRDTKTYSEVIYSEFSDTHKLSNGEYQLGLDVQNSPYPMAQYYSWRVVSKSSTITSVSIDSWGNVTIVGTGNIVIEGYDYRYNENYGVRINLTVTN